jgi:hypothetical protein
LFGTSYPAFKTEVRDYLFRLFPKGAIVLDVGAGDGIYGKLLHEKFQLDASDIYHKTVEHLIKTGYYVWVFEGDIRNANFTHAHYDLIILGDIIEHMTVADAQEVIKNCEEHSDYVLIAVPYLYQQSELYGNKAEIHLQPDLTPEIFNQRYPGFERIFGDEKYGYYLKKKGS